MQESEVETQDKKPELIMSVSNETKVSYLEGYRDGTQDMLMWLMTALVAVFLVGRMYGSIQR